LVATIELGATLVVTVEALMVEKVAVPVNVGAIDIANVVPVPVCEAIDVTFPVLVIGPVRFALVVTVPAVSPEAVPVILVPTRAEGVPSAGDTRVGLFESTTVEPIPVVEPAVKLPPDVVATTGIDAPIFVVIVDGEIVANVAIPENDGVFENTTR
jgi:hypothetical protein